MLNYKKPNYDSLKGWLVGGTISASCVVGILLYHAVISEFNISGFELSTILSFIFAIALSWLLWIRGKKGIAIAIAMVMIFYVALIVLFFLLCAMMIFYGQLF